LASLTASRAGRKRLGVGLAGWHHSLGEQKMRVDGGRHLPTAQEKLQEGIPPTISSLLQSS